MEHSKKTSALQINWITTDIGGKIGLTSYPGKTHSGKKTSGSIENPGTRPLDLDLQLIRENASILLSLIEDREFSILEIEDLGETARTLGLHWIHMPITDFNIPDEGTLARWREHSRTIRDKLGEGKNVVIHCWGGHGRTGMVSVMLLVDLGMPPRDALTLVRKTRPGTVETPQQEEFCLAYKGFR